MDKLKAFESFVSVATRGSLTAAAKAEGATSAIMGRRLDALEEHLGVKLLVRTTRRISLTHEGSAFLEDCQRLLSDVANAEASVSEGGVKATGHLRITAPAGFGRRHVAPLVPRFRSAHPDVTISLNLSDRVVDLAGEGFDCAVRVGDLPDSSLVSVRIADNRRLCVATPEYLARRGTPRAPAELVQHDCLTLSSDASQTRGWAFRVPLADGATEVMHLKPGGPLDCSDGQVLHDGWLGHCLAQHLGGRGRDRRRPTGRGTGGLCRPAQWHLRGLPPAQAPASARAAVDRAPQAPVRAARVLERPPGRLMAPWQTAHSMSSAPTLLVADDHPLFRAAVLHVLRERLPQSRTLEAASATTLGQALQEHPEIELVLLDLSMPGTRGFSALLHVRGEYPELPVGIISSNDPPRVIRRAQQFGAAGFIPKSAPADAMGDAIQAVLDGGSGFPPMAAERSEADAELAARLAQLTPQQFRVLLCLADGLLNKQIAAALGLAENTVKVHVTAILKKLACYSRTQAAVLVKSLETEDGVSS